MKKSGYIVLLAVMSLLGVVACTTTQNQTDSISEVVETVSEAAPVAQPEAVAEVVVAEAAPAQNEAAPEVPDEAVVAESQASTLQFLDAYADW